MWLKVITIYNIFLWLPAWGSYQTCQVDLLLQLAHDHILRRIVLAIRIFLSTQLSLLLLLDAHKHTYLVHYTELPVHQCTLLLWLEPVQIAVEGFRSLLVMGQLLFVSLQVSSDITASKSEGSASWLRVAIPDTNSSVILPHSGSRFSKGSPRLGGKDVAGCYVWYSLIRFIGSLIHEFGFLYPNKKIEQVRHFQWEPTNRCGILNVFFDLLLY